MIQRWIEEGWYRGSWRTQALTLLLLPLSLLFCLLVTLRRWGYRLSWLSSFPLSVPIIVIGNLSVGGTGKTPLVIALAHWLRQQGYHPAIISRGYGRRDESVLQQVSTESDPAEVGDEPLLIARESGAAVYVCSDRVAAAKEAIRQGADLILSDDGLQHYRLQRTVELAVVDGERLLGNRLCLPAGPLREPPSRLQSVDAVVINGEQTSEDNHFPMLLQPQPLYRLDNPQQHSDLADLAGKGVHAVAGIGNPQRFFDLLRKAKLNPILHPFSDHHQYNNDELRFEDASLPLLMTEKDAVKCKGLAIAKERTIWVVPVEAELDRGLQQLLLKKINVETR